MLFDHCAMYVYKLEKQQPSFHFLSEAHPLLLQESDLLVTCENKIESKKFEKLERQVFFQVSLGLR